MMANNNTISSDPSPKWWKQYVPALEAYDLTVRNCGTTNHNEVAKLVSFTTLEASITNVPTIKKRFESTTQLLVRAIQPSLEPWSWWAVSTIKRRNLDRDLCNIIKIYC
jgi:hypothetical protein